MKELVIHVTPSRIKLLICIFVIIGLGYYTNFYYNQYVEYHTKYNELLTGGIVQTETNISAENQTITSETTEKTTAKIEEAKTTEKSTEENTNTTSTGTIEGLSGKLDITLKTPIYEIKEVGETKKAVISFLEFTVKNGMDSPQTLIVEFHAYDYDEMDENKIAARDTESVSLPTIQSGGKITKKVIFPTDNKINLYNLDKKKVIHLDFIDKKAYDDSKERKIAGLIKQDLVIKE